VAIKRTSYLLLPVLVALLLTAGPSVFLDVAMNLKMAWDAQGDDIITMFWCVAIIVMPLTCWLAAGADKCFCGGQRASGYAVSDAAASTHPVGMRFGMANAIFVLLKEALRRFKVFVAGTSSIKAFAFFTPGLPPVPVVAATAKQIHGFGFLAFGAGFLYDAVRHGLFLIKRLCSGPMTGYAPFSARSIIAFVLLPSKCFSLTLQTANEDRQ